MKARDPRLAPAVGDAICFREWTITVLNLEGDSVVYAADKGSQHKVNRQTLEEWRSWAPGAKVIDDGRCTVSDALSGPCPKCGVFIDKQAHLSKGEFCCQNCCTEPHQNIGLTRTRRRKNEIIDSHPR